MGVDTPSQARVVVVGAGIVGCSAAYHLTRVLCDVGPRDGVLNMVMAHRTTLDEALLGDARIADVSFTGSTEVGRSLQRKTQWNAITKGR